MANKMKIEKDKYKENQMVLALNRYSLSDKVLFYRPAFFVFQKPKYNLIHYKNQKASFSHPDNEIKYTSINFKLYNYGNN